ncbi:helix-turn-helix domain-containing protein [Achromobacter aloeverae]
MDPGIEAAARALAAGDPLDALNRVALRDDAPAMALRGVAMAQIGDMARARALVRRAARAFGARAPVAQARCRLAEAEIALATRQLAGLEQALDGAQAVFDTHGDRANAVYSRLLQARRRLLTGDVDQAQAGLSTLDPTAAPPAMRALHALLLAGIALRKRQARAARQALERAEYWCVLLSQRDWSTEEWRSPEAAGDAPAAQKPGIAGLAAEVEAMRRALAAPAACLLEDGAQRPLRLDDVEALLDSPVLVIDGCRHAVQSGAVTIALARSPTLFALIRALGEAWPGDVSRAVLVRRVFRGKAADESYRARLRVEIGRLRAALRPLAGVRATAAGYALILDDAPRPPPRTVAVLTPPVDQVHADLLALLADGEAWSSSALALALGVSQRTLQRALDALAARGQARPLGRGRARRWTAPAHADIATNFLLTGTLAAA